jgi:hypothetical protein
MVNNNVRFEIVVKKPFVGGGALCTKQHERTRFCVDDAMVQVVGLSAAHEHGMCTRANR